MDIPLTLSTIRGVMVGVITNMVPELFDKDIRKGAKFHCSDTFVHKYLRERLGWSLRAGTRTAQKLPENYEEILLEAFLREAWLIRDFNIPATLRVNTDQTQSVYQPGTKMTWNKKGAKQVDVCGKDEKHAFTLVPSISASGEVLPMQAIYRGASVQSCPSRNAMAYAEAQELGFLLEPSGTDTYWLTLDTMKNLVNNIVAPYFESKKVKMTELSEEERKGQFSIWKIDCWSVHRSEEFLKWMKETHPNILVVFVPGSCTGVFQPLDVGIQRVLKHSIKQSAHRDVVAEVLTVLKNTKGGSTSSVYKMDMSLPMLRDRSLSWIVRAYHAISKPELVKKAGIHAMLRWRYWPESFAREFDVVGGTKAASNGTTPHTYRKKSKKTAKSTSKSDTNAADQSTKAKKASSKKAKTKMAEKMDQLYDGDTEELAFQPEYEDACDVPLTILVEHPVHMNLCTTYAKTVKFFRAQLIALTVSILYTTITNL
ncbi:hypothetical protein VKT23_017487 [Stygiomarasmius scandens]|uniref:DDE-1 domain-containing protein n=1 Tax=Marasmiellus scandens TaxID=2682957 RepID=A0ABR1IVA7_9AGAR